MCVCVRARASVRRGRLTRTMHCGPAGAEEADGGNSTSMDPNFSSPATQDAGAYPSASFQMQLATHVAMNARAAEAQPQSVSSSS